MALSRPDASRLSVAAWLVSTTLGARRIFPFFLRLVCGYGAQHHCRHRVIHWAKTHCVGGGSRLKSLATLSSNPRRPRSKRKILWSASSSWFRRWTVASSCSTLTAPLSSTRTPPRPQTVRIPVVPWFTPSNPSTCVPPFFLCWVVLTSSSAFCRSPPVGMEYCQ